MKKAIFLAIFFLFYGCATAAHNLNKISLGMTKEEVIKVMGEPTSTSAINGVEYLNYNLRETYSFGDTGNTPYFVRLMNGKVEAYGRRGDFNSTKPPEHKETIDLNINK